MTAQMIPAIINGAALIGFLSLWLGGFLICISFIIPVLTHPAYWKSFSVRFSERFRISGELMTHAFQTAGKSRFNRIGQVLGAIGLSILLVTGLLWLALRIAYGPHP